MASNASKCSTCPRFSFTYLPLKLPYLKLYDQFGDTSNFPTVKFFYSRKTGRGRQVAVTSYLFAHFVYAAIFKRAERPAVHGFQRRRFSRTNWQSVLSLCVRENTWKALGIGRPEGLIVGPPVSFRYIVGQILIFPSFVVGNLRMSVPSGGGFDQRRYVDTFVQ